MSNDDTAVPEILTQADLRRHLDEARRWRMLLTALATRGYHYTTPTAIAAQFPTMNDSATTPTAHLAPTTGTPPHPHLSQPLDLARGHAQIQPTATIDVRQFAEADTPMGLVEIGYTETGNLAFTFTQHTPTATYLIPMADVLGQLIGLIRANRVTSPRQAAQPPAPTRTQKPM